MYQDYLDLLAPNNNKERQVYAIQNLETIIDDSIKTIMMNKEDYHKLLDAIEV